LFHKIVKNNNFTKKCDDVLVINQKVLFNQDVDFKRAAINFKIGDIVSFIDSSGIRIQGVVTKKNPKTLQVTTEKNYYVNIPAIPNIPWKPLIKGC
jgi:hypothetical protein